MAVAENTLDCKDVDWRTEARGLVCGMQSWAQLGVDHADRHAAAAHVVHLRHARRIHVPLQLWQAVNRIRYETGS